METRVIERVFGYQIYQGEIVRCRNILGNKLAANFNGSWISGEDLYHIIRSHLIRISVPGMILIGSTSLSALTELRHSGFGNPDDLIS